MIATRRLLRSQHPKTFRRVVGQPAPFLLPSPRPEIFQNADPKKHRVHHSVKGTHLHQEERAQGDPEERKDLNQKRFPSSEHRKHGLEFQPCLNRNPIH